MMTWQASERGCQAVMKSQSGDMQGSPVYRIVHRDGY